MAGREPTKSEAIHAKEQDTPKPDKPALEQARAEHEASQQANPEREARYAEQRREAERIAKADHAPVDPNMLPPNDTSQPV